MTIIRTSTDQEAEGLVAELYRDDLQSLGHRASHTRVMAVNPEAVVAFEGLVRHDVVRRAGEHGCGDDVGGGFDPPA